MRWRANRSTARIATAILPALLGGLLTTPWMAFRSSELRAEEPPSYLLLRTPTSNPHPPHASPPHASPQFGPSPHRSPSYASAPHFAESGRTLPPWHASPHREPAPRPPVDATYGYSPGYGFGVSTSSYSYGWFGAPPRQHWTRHFGTSRDYTQWSSR